MTTEKQFTIKGKDVVLKPEEGTIENGEFKVNEVKVQLNGETHTVEMDEMQEWDEAAGTVMNYLALDQLEYKVKDKVLVDAKGEDTASVGKDTKIFRCILACAHGGPISSDEIEEKYGLDNASSSVSNGTYRGFIEAVAEEGNTHYYVPTAKGWREVIKHYGILKWRKKAYELQSNSNAEEDGDSHENSDTRLDEYAMEAESED